MVRFEPPKDGKVRIGIHRKDLEAHIKATFLGRQLNVAKGIEAEYSISCPEHEVELPPFWVGKYEVTCGQWHHFLEQAGKVVYTVPAEKKPGARTLEEISRLFLVAEPFMFRGQMIYPTAVDWRGLYDLNEEAVNPRTKEQDPKTRPAPDLFQNRPLLPGTKITCYRYSVPRNWRKNPLAPLQDRPPDGWETYPVTDVTVTDARVFASYYGCHLLREVEWEAAARGPKGEIYPEGKEFNPLGRAWKDFNVELLKAQQEAPKRLQQAQRSLESARNGGSAKSISDAQAQVDWWNWVIAARELPDFNAPGIPPFVQVGLFPAGTAPCGAMDILGNVDEWVSTPLAPYPGTDSKSDYLAMTAFVLRGCNVLDNDSLLTAVFRKVAVRGIPIPSHYKAYSAGFRVGRYEAPGASQASVTTDAVRGANPPVLPREVDKAHRVHGPDLDIYRGIGIERVDEVAWNSRQPATADPPGKVFHLGPAQSLALIPATGMPFRDPADIKRAAVGAAKPAPGAKDKRQPRDVPFLGLLHMTSAMQLKGEVRVSKVRERPLTPEELKRIQEEREALKKARDEKAKEEEKKDGGAEPEKPKMHPKGGSKKGGGDPPPDEGPKEGEADGAGEEAPAEETKEEEKDPLDQPLPTTTTETYYEYVKDGYVTGAGQSALLVGLVKVGEDVRPALWEARSSSVASAASVGTAGWVLLEDPLVLLPKDSWDVKKVSKPQDATSEFDEPTGQVRLVFYVPVENKSDWIEVRLTVTLRDYPTDRPWNSRPPASR
jgi:formylglycine-generating enzyme required for sulfatase activity